MSASRFWNTRQRRRRHRREEQVPEVLEHHSHINKAPPGEQVPQPPELVSDGLGDSTATVSTDGLTEVARTDLVSDGLGDSTATVSLFRFGG